MTGFLMFTSIKKFVPLRLLEGLQGRQLPAHIKVALRIFIVHRNSGWQVSTALEKSTIYIFYNPVCGGTVGAFPFNACRNHNMMWWIFLFFLDHAWLTVLMARLGNIRHLIIIGNIPCA